MKFVKILYPGKASLSLYPVVLPEDESRSSRIPKSAA